MTETMHSNLSVLTTLDLQNLDGCRDIFADDFVWHYFNPDLPKLEGDYFGVDGLKNFFAKLNETSNGSFKVNLIDARPVGNELVVVQVCNCIDWQGGAIEFDAVVVWRVVENKLSEAWDIPAINTVRPKP